MVAVARCDARLVSPLRRHVCGEAAGRANGENTSATTSAQRASGCAHALRSIPNDRAGAARSSWASWSRGVAVLHSGRKTVIWGARDPEMLQL